MFDLKTIAAVYGGRASPTGDTAQIPAPGHSKRDRSVSLRRTQDGKLLIHCFSDTDWRDIRTELLTRGFVGEDDFPSGASKHARTPPQSTPIKTVKPRLDQNQTLERAKHLWETRLPVSGSLAEIYLRSRGLGGLTRSSELGFYPSAQVSAEGAPLRAAPSLLARILDRQGAFMGLQLTILAKSSGRKRFRLVLGRQRGGAIRLGPPDQGSLLVAEGLETAASAGQLFNVPAWALLNADNLTAFNPPPDVAHLIVAADRDRAGLKAAQLLGDRLRAGGLKVETLVPVLDREDWNDVLRRAVLNQEGASRSA